MDKEIYVDKIKEVEVEKKVEVPYNVQKYIEKIYNKNVDVPVFK